MPDWDVQTWIAAASALVAAASLSANFFTVRRQVRLQREELRAAVDAGKLAWFERCLDCLAELKALARGGRTVFSGGEFDRRRIEIAERLSALADQGRLYFPNLASAKGRHKDEAYRGERPAALGALLVGFDVAANLDAIADDAREDVAGLLFKSRRIFVSQVQKTIDPRRRAAMLGGAERVAARADRAAYDTVMDVVGELHERHPIRRSAFHS